MPGEGARTLWALLKTAIADDAATAVQADEMPNMLYTAAGRASAAARPRTLVMPLVVSILPIVSQSHDQ